MQKLPFPGPLHVAQGGRGIPGEGSYRRNLSGCDMYTSVCGALKRLYLQRLRRCAAWQCPPARYCRRVADLEAPLQDAAGSGAHSKVSKGMPEGVFWGAETTAKPPPPTQKALLP